MKLPSGRTAKTIYQLMREFTLPLCAASVWTFSVLWGEPKDLQSIGANFGSAFFFASWLTGQVFRVRKQAGVEASLNKLQSRLGEVVEEFQEKAHSTIDHITGGDSYCYAEPQLSRPSYYPIQWMVRNAGAYPMYQVSVKIDDLNSRKIFVPGALHMDSKEVILGDIPCDVARHFDWCYVGQDESRQFTLTFEARNGILIQDVIIKRINDELDFAYRLKKNDEESTVLKEVVSAHFPKNADGTFDWSEPPVSGYDGLSFHSNLEQIL